MQATLSFSHRTSLITNSLNRYPRIGSQFPVWVSHFWIAFFFLLQTGLHFQCLTLLLWTVKLSQADKNVAFRKGPHGVKFQISEKAGQVSNMLQVVGTGCWKSIFNFHTPINTKSIQQVHCNLTSAGFQNCQCHPFFKMQLLKNNLREFSWLFYTCMQKLGTGDL